MRAVVRRVACAVLLGSLVVARGADPEVDPRELPRFQPLEPDRALASFQIRPGFHLELVASEPLVRSPIEVCFDADGRLFVVEMVDYSELRDARPHLGRIKMLEDTDGDGRYDRGTIYADDLPWPTGVFCANGGIYVAATPDILFFKDTDGDGRADVREVVFTGFASDFAPYQTNRLNVQAMLNSFRWGLDNRIHGCTAPNGGEVRTAALAAGSPLNLRGRDFAFDPRTRQLAAEAGGGQYGMCFDDAGRRFTCNNSDHVRVFMYDARYADRNPYASLPPPLASIAADGPAAEVYRTSPDEPWRVIRTRWRVTGVVAGLIEGGGRPSGYFTSATGLCVYRGDAWPAAFRGDVFVADCGSNLVHRKKVRPEGVGLVAERPTDEQKKEFLTSTDTWFRPVQLANAPDGTLYVVDMYREIIEHPWSLPPTLKKHLDLNAGSDRGRIYRIVPDGFTPRPPPRLSQATTAELVRTLDHRNAWHRETAARLLYERQDKAAVPALEQFLKEPPSPLGRVQALHTLDGLSALRPDRALAALHDPDAQVREHAVALSERFLAGRSADAHPLEDALMGMTRDPSVNVRYQLAFTLGELRRPERIAALERILRQDPDDTWIRAAVLSSLRLGAGELFDSMAREGGAASGTGLAQFLRELAGIIGAENEGPAVRRVRDYAASSTDRTAGIGILLSLGEGLQRAGAPLPTRGLEPLLAAVRARVSDASQSAEARREGIELLGLTSFAEAGETLLSLLNLQEPQATQLAVIAALGRFNDARVAPALIERCASFSPRLRAELVRVLVARPERATTLLQAIDAGQLRPTDLNSTQMAFLRNHRDPAVRTVAGRVLGAASTARRQEVVEAFQPALKLEGDAARGRKIFVERCVSCHRLGGEGSAVGPDLVSVRNNGREKLLVSILDPSREVLPQYLAYEVETRDGESLLGLMVNETAASITLRQAYARDTVVMRANIDSLRSRGLSMMPDELEAGLSLQAFADLLEFVMTADK